MNCEELLEMSTLSEVIIFANTPNYVYTHFQRNPSLRDFSNSIGDRELAKLIVSLSSKKKLPINKLVVLYASVIVLFARRGQTTDKNLQASVEGSSIQWLRELSLLAKTKVLPTTDVIVQPTNRSSSSIILSALDYGRTTIDSLHTVSNEEEQ